MPRKREELKGRRFGKLEVLEFAGLQESGRQHVGVWLCRCDCGNTCIVPGNILKAGRKKSCGCLRVMSENLRGMRFGKLTVLGEDKEQKTTMRKVLCRCDCGNTKSIPFRELKNGKIKSCGCDVQKISSKKDYFEQHFDQQQEEKRALFIAGDYSQICTLNDWIYIWLRDVLKGVVKESTLVMYGNTMERHILPKLGDLPLKEISASVVAGWVKELHMEEVSGTVNETMTEGSVRNTLSVLSGCMRDAQKYGFIENNPCLEPAWKMPSRNVNEVRGYLDDAQLKALMPLLEQYRNEDGYPLGICFELALYTGLFMSEAAALRWGDIDFSEKTLTVRHFISLSRSLEGGNKYCLEDAVGRRLREVPVPGFFLDRLREIQERFSCEEDAFISSARKQEPLRMDRMRAALLRKGEKAGVGKVTPQMLRDTYAVRAVRAGATSDMIAELMGFASPQQVVRRYMPKETIDKRELVNRMYG